jgi:hypothetical protein
MSEPEPLKGDYCWCGRRIFQRRELPSRRGGENFEFTLDGQRFFASVRYASVTDLQPREVFLNSEKPDSAVDLAARDAAVLVSIALQYGVELGELKRSLSRNLDGSAGSPIAALLDLLTAKEEPST